MPPAPERCSERSSGFAVARALPAEPAPENRSIYVGAKSGCRFGLFDLNVDDFLMESTR